MIPGDKNPDRYSRRSTLSAAVLAQQGADDGAQ